ncbi:MaoC/PaaZ C-terminal domain-containing protein [Nocardia sp. NPDC049707]|uniref:MaoC/PaaZ C-terminal domain-containing protein n=1 Tax=Nocardia sp. NPDC049707 TaxID=3154735 RepID=UPI003443B799
MTSIVAEVGYEVPALKLPPITRTTLALFAGASGDHNPLHIDTDAAKAAGFDDVFSHGLLSMAYLARLLTNLFPQEQIRSYQVRFGAITPVYAEPICSATVAAIERDASETRATLDLRVVMPDGTVTLTGEAVVVVD